MLRILMANLKAAKAQGQELISKLSLKKTKLDEEDRKVVDRSKALDACVQLPGTNSRCSNYGIDLPARLSGQHGIIGNIFSGALGVLTAMKNRSEKILYHFILGSWRLEASNLVPYRGYVHHKL